MKRHWYFISVFYCPLCGREREYRERRYGRKPKTTTRKFIQDWDGCDW